MESCLYECRVLHARLAPRTHAFAYRIFLFALELDELPELHRRLRLFSAAPRARNLYSFRDADFLPIPAAPGASLKQRLLAHLAAHGVDPGAGARVTLIALPRIAGYLFNPVSFYFVRDSAGRPIAALPEVTNTFREVKPYLLGPDTRRADGTFHLRVPKHFYVSPFSDVDVAFDFTLRPPGERLAIQIDDYTAGARTLTSTLTGTAAPLTDRQLAWFSVKYPLLSLHIIGLIHWHALRLWLKRVPWFAKSARAADQRDLHRPHRSLSAPSRPSTSPAA